MTLHFYHQLKFEPSQLSSVTASYTAKTDMGGKRSFSSFYLEYDISTGGTWKGDIESFALFIHNQAASHTLERIGAKAGSPEFEKTSIGDDFTAYVVQNYAPGSAEYFKITGLRDGDYSIQNSMMNPAARVGQIYQDCVKNVNASSFLPGKMRIREWGVVSDVDDGIGQWIEFTLTRDAFCPFAANGLAQQVPCVEANPTWLNNNRVKKMGLYKNGERMATLEFEDHFGGFPRVVNYIDDKFEANAVKKNCIWKREPVAW